MDAPNFAAMDAALKRHILQRHHYHITPTLTLDLDTSISDLFINLWTNNKHVEPILNARIERNQEVAINGVAFVVRCEWMFFTLALYSGVRPENKALTPVEKSWASFLLNQWSDISRRLVTSDNVDTLRLDDFGYVDYLDFATVSAADIQVVGVEFEGADLAFTVIWRDMIICRRVLPNGGLDIHKALSNLKIFQPFENIVSSLMTEYKNAGATWIVPADRGYVCIDKLWEFPSLPKIVGQMTFGGADVSQILRFKHLYLRFGSSGSKNLQEIVQEHKEALLNHPALEFLGSYQLHEHEVKLTSEYFQALRQIVGFLEQRIELNRAAGRIPIVPKTR